MPQKWPLTLPWRRRRLSSAAAAVVRAEAGVRKEDIVIVGAGIAGLATAVALQRFVISQPS